MKQIVKMLFGSHLYGTATENSDTDYKSVFIPRGRDIVLGRVRDSINMSRSKAEYEKNTAADVEEESFSFKKYLQLLAEGQTVSVDMLFAPISAYLDITDEWNDIIENRDRLISKRPKAFIGYCMTQAAKYGIKGSRVSAAKLLLDIFNDLPDAKKVGEVFDSKWIEEELKSDHIKLVDLPQASGGTVRHINVCGKLIPYTVKIKEARNVLQKFYDNYGQRALLASANQGVDWKALSHAVRIAEQAIELLKYGYIFFPRPNAIELLNIKKGLISYDMVADKIVNLLEEVNEASENSSLPEDVDHGFIDNLIYSTYRKEIESES